MLPFFKLAIIKKTRLSHVVHEKTRLVRRLFFILPGCAPAVQRQALHRAENLAFYIRIALARISSSSSVSLSAGLVFGTGVGNNGQIQTFRELRDAPFLGIEQRPDLPYVGRLI